MDDYSELSVAQLLRMWAASSKELKARGVIKTSNMVGEIAEAVAHAYLGGTRGSFSQAGWDIKTETGERVQVKAVWRTAHSKRRNTSPIRDSDYDSVLVIEFDEYFETATGLVFDRALVEELFPVRPYVNGRIIALTQRFRADERVAKLDLTSYLQSL